jgi:hypothetical protein
MAASACAILANGTVDPERIAGDRAPDRQDQTGQQIEGLGIGVRQAGHFRIPERCEAFGIDPLPLRAFELVLTDPAFTHGAGNTALEEQLPDIVDRVTRPLRDQGHFS